MPYWTPSIGGPAEKRVVLLDQQKGKNMTERRTWEILQFWREDLELPLGFLFHRFQPFGLWLMLLGFLGLGGRLRTS
jgi:hypothetical protein